MKQIFQSNKLFTEDDNSTNSGSTEQILIYEFDDEYESEDFEILSHSEMLSSLNLKEDKTPESNHASVTRYYFDVSTRFLIVRVLTITW